jgi:hypothetical protein
MDLNFNSDGRYFVPNYEVASITKNNKYLVEELTSQDELTFQL